MKFDNRNAKIVLLFSRIYCKIIISINMIIGGNPMKTYFSTLHKIEYEGKTTDNPLAFRYYNPDEVIAG